MKRFLKAITFLLIGSAIFYFLNAVLIFKYHDGVMSLKNYYKEEKNSIDVVFFGTSHTFIGVNPAVLWEDEGIVSYDLCGSAQPLWNTYYYMKESIKSQKPKLFVLDVYAATYGYEYADYGRIVKNNIGLKFSLDKIESIKASAHQDLWWDLLLGFPTYHARYGELQRDDFKHFFWDGPDIYKGHSQSNEWAACKAPDVSNILEKSRIPEKNFEYLIKIIELAKDNNIELLLIDIPYVISDNDQRINNSVQGIADQYGLKFLNLNLMYDKIGFDFSTDMRERAHINISGTEKVSAYLASYIKNHYNIPDRRGDSKYNDWTKSSTAWKSKMKKFFDKNPILRVTDKNKQ